MSNFDLSLRPIHSRVLMSSRDVGRDFKGTLKRVNRCKFCKLFIDSGNSVIKGSFRTKAWKL